MKMKMKMKNNNNLKKLKKSQTNLLCAVRKGLRLAKANRLRTQIRRNYPDSKETQILTGITASLNNNSAPFSEYELDNGVLNIGGLHSLGNFSKKRK